MHPAGEFGFETPVRLIWGPNIPGIPSLAFTNTPMLLSSNVVIHPLFAKNKWRQAAMDHVSVFVAQGFPISDSWKRKRRCF